jgi:photosystem II stability/assembly factor-like uncharacterized protein
MTRVPFYLLLILLLTISCATELEPALPTRVVKVIPTATPPATFTPSPTLMPTATPIVQTSPEPPAATSTPTIVPAPAVEHQLCGATNEGLICSVDFHTVAMWDEQTGWIFGDKGVVLRYDVAPGESTPTWRQSDNLPEPYPLKAFSPVSTTEGWGVMGYVIHYQDGVWEDTQEIKGAELRDIIMLNTSEGWSVGRDASQPTRYRDGLIFHYSQGEWLKAFTLPYREGLLAIDMLNSEEGWVVGSTNIILHFWNQQWEQITPALDRGYALIDVDVVSEKEAWFVGGWIILHYYNGNWEEVASNLTKKLLFDPAIDMISEEEGWIAGRNGYILHYEDGQWQEVDSPTDNDLLSISMVSAEEGWAVGRKGTILHYQNGEWELVSEAQ